MKTANGIKVDRAKWHILKHSPFFSQLIMRLTDKAGSVTVAKVNGVTITWNESWLEKSPDEEVRFVNLHEVLHCALGHLWRFPKPSKLVHAACDYVINSMIRRSGIPGLKMPAGGLDDTRFDGMAEEEVYRILLQENKGQDGPSDPQNDPTGGYSEPADGKNGNGESEQDGQEASQKPASKPGNGKPVKPAKTGKDLKEDWEAALREAEMASQAAGCGDAPGCARGAIQSRLTTQLDWKAELADFARDAMATRNDWTRSSRRDAWRSVIMPRKRTDQVGLIVFVRDTSGSIGTELLGEFNGQIESCLGSTGCRAMVLDCDSAIAGEYWIEPGMPVPGEADGGGGTDFRPPFARIGELVDGGESISGIVYMTDLDSCNPEPSANEVRWPTLWLCTTSRTAQTGRTVRVL